MKGIVYETATGYVRYKFDTGSLPTLLGDESYALREDINDIEVGATYDPITDTYINPTPPTPIDCDSLQVRMFSTQGTGVMATNSPDYDTVTDIGTTFVGFGAEALLNMEGFTKIHLRMYGAMGPSDTGTVTVKVRDKTNSTDLISLSFSDTTLQIREAEAAINLTGIHRLQIKACSTVDTDDPLFGTISIALCNCP